MIELWINIRMSFYTRIPGRNFNKMMNKYPKIDWLNEKV